MLLHRGSVASPRRSASPARSRQAHPGPPGQPPASAGASWRGSVALATRVRAPVHWGAADHAGRIVPERCGGRHNSSPKPETTLRAPTSSLTPDRVATGRVSGLPRGNRSRRTAAAGAGRAACLAAETTRRRPDHRVQAPLNAPAPARRTSRSRAGRDPWVPVAECRRPCPVRRSPEPSAGRPPASRPAGTLTGARFAGGDPRPRARNMRATCAARTTLRPRPRTSLPSALTRLRS